MKDWKKELSEQEFNVMRNKGTELPFSGKYFIHNESGIYTCKGCGENLFDSDSKFNTNCGWPSFDNAMKKGKIIEISDKTHGMIRTKVICGNCKCHLGHVFNDGPTDSGLRYCINSISLDFESK